MWILFGIKCMQICHFYLWIFPPTASTSSKNLLIRDENWKCLKSFAAFLKYPLNCKLNFLSGRSIFWKSMDKEYQHWILWTKVNILIYLIKYSEIIACIMEQIFYVKTYYETKSFKIVQARYREKFNFNTFPNRTQIFGLIKNFEAYGF